jgi:hypothetical protein
MVRRSPSKIVPSPTANKTDVSRKNDTNAIGAYKQAHNTMPSAIKEAQPPTRQTR